MTPDYAPVVSMGQLYRLGIVTGNRIAAFEYVYARPTSPSSRNPVIEYTQVSGESVDVAQFLTLDFARWMRRHHPMMAESMRLFPTDPTQRALLELLETDNDSPVTQPGVG